MATKISINGPLFPYSENDSRLIEDQIRQAGPDAHLEVHWHSPGGSVWEGKKLFSLFNNHAGQVDHYVDGLCASAAAYAAMSGERLFVYEYSEFMIHSAMTAVFWVGNAKAIEEHLIPDLQRQTVALRRQDQAIANIFATRAGLDVPKVMEWMAAETTWTGKEIHEVGFATHLIPLEKRTGKGPENLAKFDLTPFNLHQTSKYHEAFAPGVEAAVSWNAAGAADGQGQDGAAGGQLEPSELDKLRRLARTQADARNRMLALRRRGV